MPSHRRDRRSSSDAAEPRVGLAMPDPLPEGSGANQGRVGYLLDAVRARPAGRRALTVLAAIMALAGVGMVAYPLVTDIYANEVLQERLDDRISSPEFKRKYRTRTIKTGDPLTRIIIPDLDVNAIVVEGTSPAALRAGAGHYPNTPLPGAVGNVGIAGHRTTYGRPFNRIDELELGATIKLETPLAVYTYRVVGHPSHVPRACDNGACWITHPNDWSVVAPTAVGMLTLTTCHPKGSAEQRLIVRAQLIGTKAKPVPRA